MAKSLSIQKIYQKYYQNIPEDIFGQIVEADELTSNFGCGKLGMYAKWLLRLYQKGKLEIEQLARLKRYNLIAVFDRMVKANMLENKDINHYNSLNDMYLVVKPYLNAQIISKNDHIRYLKNSEAEKLYEDDKFLVVYPKTKRTSQLYGGHTEWCTATNRYTTDYFENYNRDGKLYIIIDKKDNKKYQFHFESNTFCNEEDEKITVNSLGAIKKITATKGMIDFFINERQNDVLRNDASGKIYIAEQGNAKDIGVYISIYRKRFGLLHGRGNTRRILLPFKYEMIIESVVPNIFEVTQNDKTELFYFYNNELFYSNISFNKLRSVQSQFDLRFYEKNLFPMLIPMRKADLLNIFAKAKKLFTRKYRRILPNCIVSNTLTAAMIEYLYELFENNAIEPYILEQQCKKTIAEYEKHIIPKILGTLHFDNQDFYLIIDNEMTNGIFRMQYSEFFKIVKENINQTK